MIRVVLTGAECTGKTTLARALSSHYDEPWSSEYARTYAENVARPLTDADVEPIAKGQIEAEDHLVEEAQRIALHDTNILSTIIYAHHYYKVQLKWLNDTFLRRNYTLYLLAAPNGIEWEADPGQRDSPEARNLLHDTFRQRLFQLQLPTIELRGSEQERFSEAVFSIDQLLHK